MNERIQPLVFLRKHASALFAAALLALLIQGVFGAHGAIALYRTRNEIRQTQQAIQKLQQQNRALENQAKALKTDPTSIERIAREEMGLARPGELVFKLPPKPNEGGTPQQPSGPGTVAPPKK